MTRFVRWIAGLGFFFLTALGLGAWNYRKASAVLLWCAVLAGLNWKRSFVE